MTSMPNFFASRLKGCIMYPMSGAFPWQYNSTSGDGSVDGDVAAEPSTSPPWVDAVTEVLLVAWGWSQTMGTWVPFFVVTQRTSAASAAAWYFCEPRRRSAKYV